MFAMTEMAGVACIFMRMTGCILFNPILSRRNFPSIFKAGLILMLTVVIAIYSNVSVSASGDFLGYCFMLFSELFVGFTLGFAVTLFTYIIIFGGEFMDLQMGLSMSKLYDPQSGISMSVSATYFNLLFTFLFFGMNGHLTLIHLFLNAAQVIPYGQAHIVNADVSMAILDLFCQCTILALKFAMPILGMQFLLEMGVGILMKTIPQINVFVVNLQVKILVGLCVIVAIFSPLASFIETLITLLFEEMGRILLLMH